MAFFRFLVTALILFCTVLVFTHGFWFALTMWAMLSISLWALLTLVGMCVRIGEALTGPREHVHVYPPEPHPDPTRPDEETDLIPFLIVNHERNGHKK